MFLDVSNHEPAGSVCSLSCHLLKSCHKLSGWRSSVLYSCIDVMLQHVALCNKPSGCVCACARQRAREHCVHVSINTQPFLLTHILCSKILSLHFLLNGLAFSPQGAYVVFPSIQWDLSDFSLHCQFGLSRLLIQSCSQACFKFLCQLYKIDPGRVSRPLGSPASARRCCSPPNSSWTLVPLSVYIWRA